MFLIKQYVHVPLAIGTILVFLLILTSTLYIPITIYKSKRTVINKLKEIADEAPVNSLTKTLGAPFDYLLETKTKKIYIKLLRGYSNYDLYINDENNTYFKKTLSNKEKKVKLNNLINVSLPIDQNKEVIKLIIIYPNCNFVFHRMTELQEEYIDFNKEIYGLNIISADNFKYLEALK